MLKELKIKSIKQVKEEKHVYDLTVYDTHNFYIGKTPILTSNCDGLSHNSGTGSSAQQSLRNVMEEYAAYSRFIFTCNYGHKIIEPIWSRVQAFYISPDRNTYIQRCLTILKAENITITPDKKQVFFDLVDNCYPDLRKCINELQKFSISSKFEPPINLNQEVNVIAAEIYNMLTTRKDMFTIRKYAIENESKFKSDYNILMKNIFDYFYDQEYETAASLMQKRKILLTIAEAMRDNNVVLDKEINFFALCIKLGDILT